MGILRILSTPITLTLALLIALPPKANGAVDCSSDSLRTLLLQAPLPKELEALAEEQANCLSEYQSTPMDSGLVSLYFEDYEAAWRHFTYLIDNNPLDSTLLAQAYLIRSKMSFLHGDFHQLVEDYSLAKRFRPDWPIHWSNLSATLYQQQRYLEALQCADSAIKYQNDSYEAWYNRALSQVDLDRYEDAIPSFDSALKHKPDLEGAWYNRGICLLDLQKRTAALASFDSALAYNHKYGRAWFFKARTLKRNSGRSDINQIIVCLDSALFYGCRHEATWTMRGDMLRREGRLVEALNDYDSALSQAHDYYPAWKQRGLALELMERPDEGLASYDSALTYYPYDWMVWLNRAYTLEGLKRYHEAVASCDTVIKYFPEMSEASTLRKQLLEKLKSGK